MFVATSRAHLTAAEIFRHTRRHWGIENLEHRPCNSPLRRVYTNQLRLDTRHDFAGALPQPHPPSRRGDRHRDRVPTADQRPGNLPGTQRTPKRRAQWPRRGQPKMRSTRSSHDRTFWCSTGRSTSMTPTRSLSFSIPPSTPSDGPNGCADLTRGPGEATAPVGACFTPHLTPVGPDRSRRRSDRVEESADEG